MDLKMILYVRVCVPACIFVIVAEYCDVTFDFATGVNNINYH